MTTTTFDALATKGDIHDMRTEIHNVRTELQNTKHEILKWVIGVAIGQAAVVIAVMALLK